MVAKVGKIRKEGKGNHILHKIVPVLDLHTESYISRNFQIVNIGKYHDCDDWRNIKRQKK